MICHFNLKKEKIMKEIEEMPKWMEKYIPAMMEEWIEGAITNIKSKSDLIFYRNSLSNSSYSYPNKIVFDINFRTKIELLKIINKDFKLD